jgi:hypothetical protein
MHLAAILGFCLVSLSGLVPRVPGLQSAAQQSPAATESNSQPAQSQSGDSTTEKSPSPMPNPHPAEIKESASGQKTRSTDNPIPPAKKPHHPKKGIYPDCWSSSSTASTKANPTKADSAKEGSTKTGSAPSRPCPPPKKVVRNGGSEEPSIQLIGGTPDQASQQRSTEQLTTATEENLKKISGRQLSSSQRETLSQIKQFMEQSKQAVASGDSERGHNLAMKAHLLSDALVKP